MKTAPFILLLFTQIFPVTTFAQNGRWLPEISQNADSLMPRDRYFDDSHAKSPTQIEANTDFYSDRVDSLMNTIYTTILDDYSSDTLFIREFKAAQDAWLKFRLAEFYSIMPPRLRSEEGSVYPQCTMEYYAAITKRRIEELLMWYKGKETDVDACVNSYKSSDMLDHLKKHHE